MFDMIGTTMLIAMVFSAFFIFGWIANDVYNYWDGGDEE